MAIDISQITAGITDAQVAAVAVAAAFGLAIWLIKGVQLLRDEGGEPGDDEDAWWECESCGYEMDDDTASHHANGDGACTKCGEPIGGD